MPSGTGWSPADAVGFQAGRIPGGRRHAVPTGAPPASIAGYFFRSTFMATVYSSARAS